MTCIFLLNITVTQVGVYIFMTYNNVNYDLEEREPAFRHLLHIPFQILLAARPKLKSDNGGPSMLICIRNPRVDVVSRFLSLVFMRFIARSHSAVLIGIR